jgi:hydroxymethyl cephem carbamoyltransferase
VLALKPGHDSAVAAIKDSRLLFSVEAEKDSMRRHREVEVGALLNAARMLDEAPDVVAVGGWSWAHFSVGSDYLGENDFMEEPQRMLGKDVRYFTSSHERSHIAMALGMAPRDDSPQKAVLVWEGYLGHLYLIEGGYTVARRIPVLNQPGARWGFLFALADESFPDEGAQHNVENSGKLMALAAYGDPAAADPAIVDTIERIVGPGSREDWHPAPKGDFRDSPVYNAGVEAEVTKTAAALLTDRLFEVFADAAQEHLPAGVPLYISGGCGLNCDWNAKWRDLGHFSSVFVPPCTDDSGSALGTAIDALAVATGDPYIDWDVYSGMEFDWDMEPDPGRWRRRPLDLAAAAEALAAGRIFAWVQGRWEIGPRALGNRSLLAAPFDAQMQWRLNQIKQREGYRPIAPCCRIEDVGTLFDRDFEDPYMLYFRRVSSRDLGAVTHVDGSARVQTVSQQTNARLHDLLSAFAARTGAGVLCNTSLNFKGFGFINRMSNLVQYCEVYGRSVKWAQGISDMVVGDAWFERIEEQ